MIRTVEPGTRTVEEHPATPVRSPAVRVGTERPFPVSATPEMLNGVPRSGAQPSGFSDPEAHSVTPRRVCHVSMHLKTGGLERLLVEFARRHDSRRFAPVFVALQDAGPPAEEIAAFGCPVYALNLAANGKLRALRELRRILREHAVSVVHTHNTYAHFYATLAAVLAGVKTVVNTQHGRGCGDHWKARLQFSLANRWAGAVVGVSEDSAGLCRRQDRLSRGKIRTIWNGIDPARFEYSGPRPVPIAIAVSRLAPEKDIPTLLRAIALAVRVVPDLRLRIVGDGRERPELERLARSLGIEAHVEFLGERSDVHALLRDVGFFVSSSRTEGISLTLLEAMAVGLPILATRVGGNAEIVAEGLSGRLVPPEDPQALAEGLIAMCREQPQWVAMGQRGRQRVERDFDVTRMVRDYERLYAELLT